jgi:hypothetical protein
MDIVTEKLVCFAMVLTRISAFFLVLPVFGWRSIPVRVKVAMTVLMAIFFMMSQPAVKGGPASALEAILLMANEATYGLALGLVGATLFSVVRFGGRIIERQMGMAMDAATGEPAGDDIHRVVSECKRPSSVPVGYFEKLREISGWQYADDSGSGGRASPGGLDNAIRGAKTGGAHVGGISGINCNTGRAGTYGSGNEHPIPESAPARGAWIINGRNIPAVHQRVCW